MRVALALTAAFVLAVDTLWRRCNKYRRVQNLDRLVAAGNGRVLAR